jgi:DNA-binding NarL/FixJ family response regulator
VACVRCQSKVLVADDSEMMRKAIRKTLDEEPRIRIVGEASSFASTNANDCGL